VPGLGKPTLRMRDMTVLTINTDGWGKLMPRIEPLIQSCAWPSALAILLAQWDKGQSFG